LHDADIAVVVLLDNKVLFLNLDDSVLVAEAADTVDEVEGVIVVVIVVVFVVIIVVVAISIASLAVSVIIVSRDKRSTSAGVGGKFSNDSGSEDGLSSY
jgi:hypothetical protein